MAGAGRNGFKPSPRHDRVDVACGMGLHPDQHIAGVVVGVHSVERAGGDEALEHGEVLCGSVVSGEEGVLAAQGEDPKGALGDIVVECELRISEEAA